MNSKKTFISLILLVFATSCGKALDSTLQHDDGKPVRSGLASNWMTIDRTTFLTKVLNTKESEALPESSPITQRFQMWIDKMDAYFRTRDPNAMLNVPKPNVVILRDANANAYVASTAVCYNVKATFGDGIKTLENGIYLDKSSDVIDTDVPANYPCLSASNSDLTFIAEEIAANNLSCQFTIDGESIHFSQNCSTTDKNYQSGFNTDKVLALKTPNWFVILSGIAGLLDSEEKMVGVIAHELGHYYRAHSNTFKSQYDFYYTQKESGNDSHKPLPDPSLEAFGKQVFQLSEVYNGISYIQNGDQYKLNPMYFLAMGDLARQMTQNHSATRLVAENSKNGMMEETTKKLLPNCKLAASFENGKNGDALSAMPFTPPKDMKVYEAFEQAAMSCLDEIEKFNLKHLIDVEKAFRSPSWAPFKKNPKLAASLDDLNALLKAFDVIGQGVQTPSSSIKESLLKEAQGILQRNVKNVAKTLVSAYRQKLGQYTVEQEADDISVEVVTLLGLGGESAVDTYMALVSKKDSFGGLAIGKQKCQVLRANNWVDPDGVFDISILPVGDYSEVHHSGCYRAFNASREISAHNYPMEPTNHLDKKLWKSMSEELSTFSKKPNQPNTLTLKKFDKLPKNCILNPKKA